MGKRRSVAIFFHTFLITMLYKQKLETNVAQYTLDTSICVSIGANLSLHTVCISMLTLTVLVTTINAQWEGMWDVGSARYKPALLPPCLTIRVLSYSN